MPFASGYFRSSHHRALRLIDTRTHWVATALLAVALVLLGVLGNPFVLDLACQVFIATIGACALMLLTGHAGQISLGHAAIMAIGAFTVGIGWKEFGIPVLVALPAAAIVGAFVGLLFGLPSLRLRGLYLAVSTLALHFIVVYLGGEYETLRGLSSGIIVDPPAIGGFALTSGRGWYALLLLAAVAAVLFSVNLARGRTGRAWRTIHGKEAVAEALGIDVPSVKLAAFVVSSAMAALSGALFAYWRGFVSIEAFSMFLTIQYVAMIIIGGMGSIAGAVLGAVFVTLFPYTIEALMNTFGVANRFAGAIYAVNYAAFGIVMILFLVFEPDGLIGIWRRVRNWFVLWPFQKTPLGGRQ